MRKLAPLLFFLLVSVAFANEYEWRDVVQTVNIQANGDVFVVDERTLWTDEDFGEAYLCINLGPSQTLTLLEDSGSLSGHNTEVFQQNCESGARGQEIVVKHPFRINEGRVRFHYKLENTVNFYSDVVEWYWIILEQEHPRIRGYDLTVTIPGSMSEPFNAYVHRYNNPEEPTVRLSDNRQTLRVSFERIPSDDGMEIVYLMNPNLFTRKGTTPGFEKALGRESEIAGIQQQERESLIFRSNPRWGLGGLGIFGALVAGLITLFRKVGREPDIQTMKYPFEPPSDLPPAAVTALGSQMFSSNMSNAFHATIMDLARRGYAEFTGTGKNFEMHLDLTKSTEGLLTFEAEVLSYLKSAAASGGEPSRLEFKELKRYSEKHASRFMLGWIKKPREWIERKLGGELITKESKIAVKRWSGICLVAGLICILTGIFFTAGLATGALIFSGIACIVMIFVGAAVLPAWRKDVAPEVYGWEGFKRTLSDYTQMKDAPDDFFKLWDKYYVYAAALGVADKYLKNIQRVAPTRGMEDTVRQRGVWMGSMTKGGNFSSFSQSISSMTSALNSASASASSGGSSSGGGGGGGGGSSGGR